MKINQITTLALFALLVFACSNNSTGDAAKNSSAVINAPPAVSPTETLKTFFEASKKKEVEAIKKTLSKGSLALAEKSAAAEGMTVDELFKRENPSMPSELPEIRGEKIEADTASVEVKNFTADYDTIPFVKEDGAWKIAFDKYQEAMMEEATRQQMNTPNTPGASATDNSANAANTAKPSKSGSSAPAVNKTKSDR